MAETLNVEIRETRGKRRARRQRQAGVIPGVLYGHGEQTVVLSLPAEQLDAAIRHGSRLVNLAGAVTEQAFIRELQWDTWGTHILHVDLTRVSAHEKVEVRVVVDLRGEAPGVRQGGVVEQPLHELDIECEVSAIPEKIEVNINHLELNQSITVADLKLPPTVRVLADAAAVVVQCSVPVEMEAEAEASAEGAEPEVIGRKKAEEGEDEE